MTPGFVRARVSAITAPVRASLARRAISSLRRKWRRCSAAASPCNAQEILGELGAECRVARTRARVPASWPPTLLAELERREALPAEYWILDVSADLRERQRANARSGRAAVARARALARCLARLVQRRNRGQRSPRRTAGRTVRQFAARRSMRSAWPSSGRASKWSERPLARRTEYGRAPDRGRHRRALAGGLRVRSVPRACALACIRSQSASRAASCCSSTTACRVASTTPPNARDGTLLCHFRHRFHDDPFTRLGLQDITAWVDFTAVAEAAQASGMEVAGFTDAGALPDRLRHRRLRRRRRGTRRCRTRKPFAADHGADAAGRNGRAVQGDRPRKRVRCAALRIRHARSSAHAVIDALATLIEAQ